MQANQGFEPRQVLCEAAHSPSATGDPRRRTNSERKAPVRPARPADRIAAAIVGLEALGVVVVAGWMTLAFLSGDVAEPATAVALLITTLVGAAALVAFAVAIVRDISWGRSGGIVAQLLILAVALGAVTGTFATPLVALGLAIPGVLGLIALVLAVRAAARLRDGERPRDGDRAGDGDTDAR